MRGEVTIELGGVERPFRLSLNAFVDAQEMLGERDFNALMARIGGERDAAGKVIAPVVDLVVVRALLTAGLRDAWPEVTPRVVGAMIDMRNLGTVMEGLTRALDASLGGDDDAPANPPAAAADAPMTDDGRAGAS